jgi:hypothetical protein
MIAIVGGYVVPRLIEGGFMRRFGNMHIHVWEKLDSDFRLITARRKPNMVILFVATIFQRPDIGLIAVAVWTVLSCLFHAVRLAQAMSRPIPEAAWSVRPEAGRLYRMVAKLDCMTAEPPRRRVSRPIRVAVGWAVATAPRVPHTVERPANGAPMIRSPMPTPR